MERPAAVIKAADDSPEAAEIARALAASPLSAIQLGATIGRSEQSARQYATGVQTPAGDIVIRMLRRIPGFAESLGFQEVTPHAT